jgi:hypothetical protein
LKSGQMYILRAIRPFARLRPRPFFIAQALHTPEKSSKASAKHRALVAYPLHLKHGQRVGLERGSGEAGSQWERKARYR